MFMSLSIQRRAGLVLAVVAFALAGPARADDPPQPRNEASTPAGQKTGRGGNAQNAAQASPVASDRRLPDDSTTKQSLDLPGRTLNFAATAGSIRVFNEKREPLADVAVTSY